MTALRLSFDDQPALLAWAAPICGTGKWPEESVAAGILDAAGAIRAVVVCNAFYDHSCAMHIASDGGRSWARPEILRQVFGFAFYVARVFRINAVIPAHNISAQIVALKLGFVFEGYLRAGATDGSDAILMAMLEPGCRWIRDEEKDHGEEVYAVA